MRDFERDVELARRNLESALAQTIGKVLVSWQSDGQTFVGVLGRP